MAKRKRKSNIVNFSALGTPLASIILSNLPYVLFLGFLMTIFIANAHYAENKMRSIRQLEREISELRWQYMAAQADLMFSSKQTEVSKRVEEIGLSDSGRRPRKIIVPNETEQ